MSLPPRMPGQAGHDGERGNALFLILIAVALFAALSYAVTQSSRGGAGIDREREKIDTAVAQQCNTMVENGVMKLKIIGHCSEDQISYELADGTNQSSTNPDDTSCFVFHNDGAGVAPCGAYLDPIVPVGIITEGDTQTYAALPAGGYARCSGWHPPNWGDSDACELELSTDGEDHYRGNLCLEIDTTDPNRDNYNFMKAFGDVICQAACGGSFKTTFAYTSSSGSGEYLYVEDDFSLTPHMGCNSTLQNWDFACQCW